ncbi:MAG: DsbE family thiol:disulfide interchange protein [Geminicoccaceae bacterium]
MIHRLVFILPVVLFAGVGLALALGLGREPSRLPSVLIDQPVPEFALPVIGNEEETGFEHADLGGEVALVNVFASWCAPCRVEHPLLGRLASEGVPIYGINYKDEPEAARAWLEELGNPFEAIGADAEGRVAIDFGVYGVPETFVVDRDGRIRYRHAGPIMLRDLETTIQPLLDELGR